jgi:PST family polysaccharide transporter
VSLKNKAVKGFAWNMLQGTGTQIISFVVFLVLARLLDPESFGLVAMATVALAFFRVFKEFGFATAIIQRKKLESGHIDTAFWTDILVNSIMMTITFLSAKGIANLYNEPRLEVILQALSLLFLTAAFSQVQMAILRRNLDFEALAIRTLIAEVIGGISAITCALYGGGVWSLVVRQLTSSLIGTLILWMLSDWRPGLKVSSRYFTDLFGFSIKMFAANIVDFFGSRSDSFFIGYFLGSISLGYYTIAKRLILLMTEFLGGAVNKVAWPIFAKLQDKPEKIRSGFYSASHILALIVMPIFLGIFSTSSELVPLMFGGQWESSIPILKILIFLGIIHSMNKMYDSIIVSVGRAGIWLGLRIAISISNVLCFFIALRWGLTGVALAYVIVAYFYLPVYLYVLNSLIDIRIAKYFGLLVAPLTAATLMVGSIFTAKKLLHSITIPNTITLPNITPISIPSIITISIPDTITIPILSIHLCILIAIGIVSYSISIMLIAPKTYENLLNTIKSFKSNGNTRHKT